MSSYSWKDAYILFTRAQPISTDAGMDAIPAGASVKTGSCIKGTMDPGGKASYLKGNSITPVAIVIGSAEPKLDLEFSNAAEVANIVQAMGGVGSTCIVSIVFARTGMPVVGYLFKPCVIENGGGFDGDDSKGFSDKIALKFTQCIKDGVSIYNNLA